jgi:hypothetical protein
VAEHEAHAVEEATVNVKLRFSVLGSGFWVLVLGPGFMVRSGHPAMQALNPIVYEIFIQSP